MRTLTCSSSTAMCVSVRASNAGFAGIQATNRRRPGTEVDVLMPLQGLGHACGPAPTLGASPRTRRTRRAVGSNPRLARGSDCDSTPARPPRAPASASQRTTTRLSTDARLAARRNTKEREEGVGSPIKRRASWDSRVRARRSGRSSAGREGVGGASRAAARLASWSAAFRQVASDRQPELGADICPAPPGSSLP